MTEEEKLSDDLRRFSNVLRRMEKIVLPPAEDLFELETRVRASREKIVELLAMRRTKETFDDLRAMRTKLQDELIEEKFRWKIAQRYGQKWQTNHVAQWIEMLNEKEKIELKKIDEYEKILRETDVAHRQTIRSLNDQNDDLRLKTNFWFERFHNETERFDRELKSFQHELNQIRDERAAMLDEYERMRIVVDEDHQRKERERLLAEQRRREEEAAKRIQAWWRGTIARHLKTKKKKKSKKKK